MNYKHPGYFKIFTIGLYHQFTTETKLLSFV